jgi:hypothetical protein
VRIEQAGFPIRSRSLHASLANSLLPGRIGPQRGSFSHQVLRTYSDKNAEVSADSI